ncbi:MAG: isocitrate lyase/phosphoenolpyruvate mutase family protein [Alphaproteobacteria bacterium]|nr:isocitrate lyase/phosphoenolpyruvate mutase family protein [Alphaproteobacteria bacterium]
MLDTPFARLHVPGRPLVLYNIWDAGSARALAEMAVPAIATGSASVAASQGYEDGEALPLEELLRTVRQIRRVTDLPLSVDFEGGYAEMPDGLAANFTRLMEAGAEGINFEDRIVKGEGLYALDRQLQRIEVLRSTAGEAGKAVFINARTDVFLEESDAARHVDLIEAAIERGQAYARAGADGFFVPGLVDPALIRQVCDAVDIPVNVMAFAPDTDLKELAACGVARISFGPFPWRWAMQALVEGYSRLKR